MRVERGSAAARALGCALAIVGCALDPDASSGVTRPPATVNRSVIPTIDAAMKPRLRAIYNAGQARGNRAAVFSKAGDDLRGNGALLVGFGCQEEALGAPTDLAATLAYFRATAFASSTTGRVVRPFELLLAHEPRRGRRVDGPERPHGLAHAPVGLRGAVRHALRA